jgi:hypothetical protein
MKNKTVVIMITYTLIAGFGVKAETINIPITSPTVSENITNENNFNHLDISDTNIKGYFPFDEWLTNTYDYSSGNNDGTNTNVNFINGIIGNGTNITGTASYITSSNTLGNFNSADFTISLWVKYSSARTEYILSKRLYCACQNFWNIRLENTGSISFETSDAACSSYNFFSTPLAYNDNTFHHLGITRYTTETGYGAMSNYIIYVDGLPKNSIRGYITPLSNTETFKIGKSACANNYNGVLDDLTIYDRALSGSEINTLFNNQTKRFKQAGYTNYNINISRTLGANITVLGNLKAFIGTSINQTLSFYNGTWNNAGTQIFSGNNNYTVVGATTNLSILLNYYSDTYNFYSPISYHNLTVNIDNDYLCNSLSDCLINCSKNNVINKDEYVNGNLFLRGNGNLTLNKNLLFSGLGLHYAFYLGNCTIIQNGTRYLI